MITGRYGTIGKVFYVEEDFWPLNTTLYVRDFHGNDPRFISYLLERVDFKTHSGKSGVPGVNRNDIHELDTPYPVDRAEQEAIAEALSDADALIESLEQLIAKKRLIKQGAMQELLTGKRRLPGFEGDERRRQTDLASLPDDWALDRIGSITTKVGSGVTPKGGSTRYRDAGRPFVRSQNVGWGELRLDDLVFIDEATHAEFPATELRMGDVLLNITGASIGRCAIADHRLAGGNVNQHVCIIRTEPALAHPEFVSAFLVSAGGQQQVDSFQAGGNREGLNFGQIGSMLVPLPPTVDEQAAIAEVLRDLQHELAALEQKLDKARMIKQGMMHNLLTGKIRLV